MVTLIDYGIGNIRSVEKAFQAVGIDVLRTDDPVAVSRATHLVLPGVGAYAACMDEIRRRSLVQPVLDHVASGRPFLGVCVGMQLLFEYGEEMGVHSGLGILPGRVVRFPADMKTEDRPKPLKVPHMGWNEIQPTGPNPLFTGLPEQAYFYFVHSYHATPDNPADVLASTRYGIDFPAVVGRNNVFGVQFHPEKSQRNGLTILSNFSRL